MRPQHHTSTSYAELIPTPLPTHGLEVGPLVQRIANNASFSPAQRVECLEVLFDRVCKQRPYLLSAFFIARVCHQVATLCKRDLRPESPLNRGVSQFLNKLATSVCETVSRFNVQDVATTAWSFGTLGHRDERLCNALSARAQEIAAHFTPQGVATTAWAFATLGHRDERLFDALSVSAKNTLTQFKPQDISNTAWAFATSGHRGAGLFNFLSSRAQEIVAQLNSQDVSNTAWAFATLGQQDDRLFNALSSQAQDIVGQFNSQNVSLIAWAFATQGHRDERLFDTLSSRAQQIVTTFRPQGISTTAWAFATLNHQDERLFQALSSRGNEILTQFEPRNVAITAWAFAVVHPELVGSVARPEDLTKAQFHDMEWLQLYQAFLASGLTEVRAHFPRYRAIAERYTASPPSDFEREVERLIRDVFKGQELSLHFSPVIAGISVDWMVSVGGRRYIVECDGTEYHRTRGPDGGTPYGTDIIQDRIFTRFGYTPVHIDSTELRAASDKFNFMRKKLRELQISVHFLSMALRFANGLFPILCD